LYHFENIFFSYLLQAYSDNIGQKFSFPFW
jgi:hypothetical protein